MPNVNRSALLPFSAESMFDLVNDVAAYPQFLPDCAQTRIEEQSSQHMKASILIAKAGIRQWFTTENQLRRGEQILMSLVDGPFRKLQGGWVFTALSEDACKIELNLDFEFANKITELAFGRVFNAIANNMVQAFSDRAKEVYR